MASWEKELWEINRNNFNRTRQSRQCLEGTLLLSTDCSKALLPWGKGQCMVVNFRRGTVFNCKRLFSCASGYKVKTGEELVPSKNQREGPPGHKISGNELLN